MKPFPDEQLLQRYILGDLSDAERIAIEEEYFHDDKLFETLLALEDELIDRYAQGLLSEKETTLFDANYARTKKARDRIGFSRTLVASLTKGASPVSGVHPSLSHLVRWIRPWLFDFGGLRPGFKISFALMAAMVLLGGWFALQYNVARRELNIAEAERFAGQEQIAALKEKLSQKESELTGLTDVREADRRPRIAIASFSLSPGLLRDAAPMRTLSLPREEGMVEFQLDIESPIVCRHYRAILKDEDQKELWSKNGLDIQNEGGLKTLNLRLNSRLLSSGRYTFVLQGRTRDDSVAHVGEYSFSIQTRY